MTDLFAFLGGLATDGVPFNVVVLNGVVVVSFTFPTDFDHFVVWVRDYQQYKYSFNSGYSIAVTPSA